MRSAKKRRAAERARGSETRGRRSVLHPSSTPGSTRRADEHLGELSSRSTSDLLGLQAEELGLELDELLGEVGLVLRDELVRADFAGGGHGLLQKGGRTRARRK